VDRLRKYGRYKKPVTAILECTNFERNPNCKLTPSYIKPEAWIAIIHGARGIAYFSHIANPMVEAGLLQDAEMCAAVTTNNALIRANASMINSPTVVNATTVESSNQAIMFSK